MSPAAPPEKEVYCCRWGYPIRTSSPQCAAALDDYFFQVLSYGRGRCAAIRSATRFDPSCAIAAALAALHLGVDGEFAGLMAAADANLGLASEYEKAVVRAVKCLVGEKDEDAAIEQHFELLKDFPRDLASLKRAQVLCFYMGLPDASLKLVEQVLPQNQNEDFIYGMLAFALLEVGKMDEAEQAGKAGVEINKNDMWSQHAICHVLQQECRFKEAVDFMETCSPSWNSCLSFMITHNWWHVAVCYLEGESPIDKVTYVYDRHIMRELEKPDSVPAEVYINGLGLLLRMCVRGQTHYVREQLIAIGDALRSKSMWHKEFHLDLLILWALASMNDSDRSDELLKSMESEVSRMRTKKRQKMQNVLKLAEAVNSYGKGDYEEVFEILGPDFRAIDYKMVGASDEQMDVFNEVWCAALLESGKASIAIEVLQKQISSREGAPFLWRLLEKAYLLQGRADSASAASSKAGMLADAYFH